MSQQNVEIVRRAYDAFNRGDFEAAARTVHPEIEFIRLGGMSPVRGVAALRAWMEPDAIEEQRFEPLDFRFNGNKVLVRQHATGRGAGSGIPIDWINFSVFTLDHGHITQLEAFLPHQEAEAREAAGLSA